MNIFEASRRWSISVTKLRNMEAAGVCKFDKVDPSAELIRSRLAGSGRLSVPQLLALHDDPDLFFDLGPAEDKARAQFDALGDYAGESAPDAIRAHIPDAANGKAESVDALGAWLRDVLPSDPVPFAWVAMRLIATAPLHLRRADQPRINLALARVRELETMAGYWKISGDGQIFYQKALDAIDL